MAVNLMALARGVAGKRHSILFAYSSSTEPTCERVAQAVESSLEGAIALEFFAFNHGARCLTAIYLRGLHDRNEGARQAATLTHGELGEGWEDMSRRRILRHWGREQVGEQVGLNRDSDLAFFLFRFRWDERDRLRFKID